MKIRLAILCLLLSACAGPQSADVAIRGATIVDVANGFLVPDHAVLIAGNRIVAIGLTDEVRIAPEPDVIDAAGGYLIPGLWDMHVGSVQEVPQAYGELWAVPVKGGPAVRLTHDKWENGPNDWGYVRLPGDR